MTTRDYFAEMYVAGLLADNQWNVYFPSRDQGFDFIITKQVNSALLIRPVQIKGKYATDGKTNKAVYGYTGKLTQLHEEMVLAIPFFSKSEKSHPIHIAFMPKATIKSHSRGYRCEPATFRNGVAAPRRDYQKFFGADGIRLLEQLSFKDMNV